MKKGRRKKRTVNPDGSIVEEENDDEVGDTESSIDSLMGENPGKY
jgi:hypothetical protein